RQDRGDLDGPVAGVQGHGQGAVRAGAGRLGQAASEPLQEGRRRDGVDAAGRGGEAVMSEQIESFLHAIREAPEDDGPRLVMADWFEDNGDPGRAEFIRAQVRLAGDLNPDERRALEQREQELLTANFTYWMGELSRKPWETTYRRGTARVKVQASA